MAIGTFILAILNVIFWIGEHFFRPVALLTVHSLDDGMGNTRQPSLGWCLLWYDLRQHCRGINIQKGPLASMAATIAAKTGVAGATRITDRMAIVTCGVKPEAVLGNPQTLLVGLWHLLLRQTHGSQPLTWCTLLGNAVA